MTFCCGLLLPPSFLFLNCRQSPNRTLSWLEMPKYSKTAEAANSEYSVASADLKRGDGTAQMPATSGATLLPRPAASLVSWLTQYTSLSLRLGTFIGGVALDGARATTLTGLELSRAVIEGILTKAGRDVAIRSSGERGKEEAESLLERSVRALFVPPSELQQANNVAGYSAFDSHLRIILCSGNVSPIVYIAYFGCQLIPVSSFLPRCHSRLHRILESDCRHRNPD